MAAAQKFGMLCQLQGYCPATAAVGDAVASSCCNKPIMSKSSTVCLQIFRLVLLLRSMQKATPLSKSTGGFGCLQQPCRAIHCDSLCKCTCCLLLQMLAAASSCCGLCCCRLVWDGDQLVLDQGQVVASLYHKHHSRHNLGFCTLNDVYRRDRGYISTMNAVPLAGTSRTCGGYSQPSMCHHDLRSVPCCLPHLWLEAAALQCLDLAPLVNCQPHRAPVHVDLGVPEGDVVALLCQVHCRKETSKISCSCLPNVIN